MAFMTPTEICRWALPLVFVITMCGAKDITDMESLNITQTKKLIDWDRPLTFTHVLDSKDSGGVVISGIILTLAVVGGLAVLASVIVIIQYIKDRYSGKNNKYGRLYNENITSVQNVQQKV